MKKTATEQTNAHNKYHFAQKTFECNKCHHIFTAESDTKEGIKISELVCSICGESGKGKFKELEV